MKDETLDSSAEIFVYLFSCPGQVAPRFTPPEMQKWFQAWFRFYSDLFKTTPEQIILTLNRMMKRSIQNRKNVPLKEIFCHSRF